MMRAPQPTERRRSSWPATAVVCAALLGPSLSAAHAQAPEGQPQSGGPATEAGSDQEKATPDSPRSALARYLALADQGQWKEAARYLDLPQTERERGAELARRLKAVLDRHLALDLQQVSGEAAGDRRDGLPPRVDQIGEVPSRGGPGDPVRLVRKNGAAEGWVFDQATVRRIDSWFAALELRVVVDTVPEELLRPGPRGLPYFQWLAILALFGVASLAGWLLGRLTLAASRPLIARTRAEWDDALLARMRGPVMSAWTLALVGLLLPHLALNRSAADFVGQLLHGGALAVLFWMLARSVDVGAKLLGGSPWASEHPTAVSLIPLGARVTKLFVLALAAVALLSMLGYPVASLLAGLGIGGLALALAAQKTVENLFGAFSIGADQPFRVGDFVRIEDFVGTVEAIGLRSTRIRTLDRTLIAIPNGKLAEMRLESFTARDRLRLACRVGLVYGTSAAQMRRVVAELERVLREHPQIWPESVIVFFTGFGDSSLDIDIMAWFQTTDWNEFQGFRQEVLLRFMEVVEDAGTALAFPTRTVHVVSPPDEPALAARGQQRPGTEPG